MKRTTIGLLVAVSLVMTACGAAAEDGLPEKTDDPLLQVRSEGGFAPVEMTLGRGPTYTLLGNGQLIHEGPVVAIYPAPLLPNSLVAEIDDDEMRQVLDLVEAIGLPDMEDERDEENGQNVADATTEVVTFWDDNGVHTYSVYALGIEPNPVNPSTKAFLELIDLLGELVGSHEATPYEGDRAQVVAGIGFADPDFPDVRDWPLEDTDFSDWVVLPNEWMCQVQDPEILPLFADATQNTQWTHPDPMMDAPPFTLRVRPLHPGEPDCFEDL